MLLGFHAKSVLILLLSRHSGFILALSAVPKESISWQLLNHFTSFSLWPFRCSMNVTNAIVMMKSLKLRFKMAFMQLIFANELFRTLPDITFQNVQEYSGSGCKISLIWNQSTIQVRGRPKKITNIFALTWKQFVGTTTERLRELACSSALQLHLVLFRTSM